MSNFVIKDGVLEEYTDGKTAQSMFDEHLSDNRECAFEESLKQIEQNGKAKQCLEFAETLAKLNVSDELVLKAKGVFEKKRAKKALEILSMKYRRLLPQDREENTEALRNADALHKVMYLEEAILDNNLERTKKIIDICAPFEFTARALGFACRFCKSDMVNLLLENGITFDYDKNSNELQEKYSIWRRESERSRYYYRFELMPIKDSIDSTFYFGHFLNSPFEKFKAYAPMPEEVRVENVKCVCEHLGKNELVGDMLYHVMRTKQDSFVQAMRKSGAVVSDSTAEQFGNINYYLHWFPIDTNYILDAMKDRGERLKLNMGIYKYFIGKKASIAKRVINECDLSSINPTKLLSYTLESAGVGAFSLLVNKGYIKGTVMRDNLIDKAIELHKTEQLAILMNYKNRTADVSKENERKQKRKLAELTAAPDSVTALKKIWSYKKNENGTLTITSYKGDEVDIIVPSKIGNNRVTVIGEEAFSPQKENIKNDDARSKISSVTIPDSVTSIEDNVFDGCVALTAVTIGSGAANIAIDAFNGCGNLCSIHISEENTAYCFVNGALFDKDITTLIRYQSKNTEAVYEIPAGITSIGEYAFSNCTSLTSIYMPNSITNIGQSAFSGCSGLSSINIPNGVTDIKDSVFKKCKSLTSITIPDNATSIGEYAFYWCTGLTSITIPAGVMNIGRDAFCGCYELKSITIPNGITRIEDSVFGFCESLTSITIPESVTSIGYSAFNSCSGLTSIEISNSVTSIGEYAFSDCTGLTSIAIPAGITSIGKDAFSKCTGLTGIEIPDSVTCIEWGAFADCSGLTNIEIPDSVTKIEGCVFAYCSGLTNIEIPNSITCIERRTFAYCSELTNIEIPNSVTCIEDGVFAYCIGLNSLEIPNSITSIGGYAFDACKGLTSITIPDSVTSIGDFAFRRCDELTSITFCGKAASHGMTPYWGCKKLTEAKIPSEIVKSYKSIADLRKAYALSSKVKIIEY